MIIRALANEYQGNRDNPMKNPKRPSLPQVSAVDFETKKTRNFGNKKNEGTKQETLGSLFESLCQKEILSLRGCPLPSRHRCPLSRRLAQGLWRQLHREVCFDSMVFHNNQGGSVCGGQQGCRQGTLIPLPTGRILSVPGNRKLGSLRLQWDFWAP